MGAMEDFGQEFGIEPHVARYLLSTAISNLPAGVLETLNGMSEDELAILERIGTSFQEAEAASWVYPCGVH